LQTTLDLITDQLRKCRNNPNRFNEQFLIPQSEPKGPSRRGSFWSRQKEIAQSVVDYRTTVAYSGNMLGKDYLFARLILWWMCTRPNSLVLVTAPTQTQIGTIVWKEIRRAVAMAPIPLGARITEGAKNSPQQIDMGNGWQALGFSTTSIERASGQHAGQLAAFVVEGSGIEPVIWEAIESWGYSKLVINGNPVRSDGVFVDLIRQAEKDQQDGIPKRLAVNAIRISSKESPHAELEKSPVGLADKTWLQAVERRYGAHSLWYKSHVLAEIPVSSADLLVPVSHIDAAIAHRRRYAEPYHPVHRTRRMSCDLGEGVGRDSSCVLVRDDWGIIEVCHGAALGLPEAAALMAQLARKYEIQPGMMSFDKLGIGKHFPNHLARYGLQNARPYAGSGRPMAAADFVNLRTEAAWRMRLRLDPMHIPDMRTPHSRNEPFSFDPKEASYIPRLREELKPLTYECYGTAVKLLDKEEWCDVLGHSPDIADTLIQSFAW
jgi:hypothetical protein